MKSNRLTARGWWPREVGQPLDRKQVQGVMRAHRLLQAFRNGDRPPPARLFRVTHPYELWDVDMYDGVWTA